ncbi:SOS response-associated peptidase [Hanstruepera marina]|uniref:SOS response-associated peptidase n=1 Tax=Hanstruepera marina TaxID=2873265 RepID=UPI001CA7A46E|nr:SOS response-associated peptidase family protein [Hanstruepera marina]
MCFHTAIWKEPEYWEKKFRVKLSDERLRPYFKKPRYHLNGFSHPNMMVIPQEKSDVLAPAVWGIVPNNKKHDEIKDYYKEAVRFGGGLNGQSEKVFNHFIYRDSIMYNRCIIPVSGFFEPHDQKGKKYPFLFRGKEDEPLALAGLYTNIDTYITFTILTRKASPLFEKVHNLKRRQPLILGMNHAHNWLSADLNEEDISEVINYSFPEERLDAYSVSKDLFNTKVISDVPDIIEPYTYEELELKI